MATSILIMSPGIQEEIKKIVDYAHAHPLNEEELRATLLGKIEAIGTRSVNNVIHLFHDFRVVYSEEVQPIGLFRHISISMRDLDGQKRLPHPIACNMIMVEFGFKHQVSIDPKEDWVIEKEFIGWLDEENNALNFLERRDP